MRVRVFVYCLLSFLPNCYFIVAIQMPRPGSFLYWTYVTARLAMHGILLVALSSLVKAQLPWCGAAMWRRKIIVQARDGAVMVEPRSSPPTQFKVTESQLDERVEEF